MGGPDAALGAYSMGEWFGELRCCLDVQGSGDEEERIGPLFKLALPLTPSVTVLRGPLTGALLGPSPSPSSPFRRSTVDVVILGSRAE